MAFKADVDDIRDSLSFKFKKILSFKGAEVKCSDLHINYRDDLIDENELIETCELIILCAPHTTYRNLNFKKRILIDVWNFAKRDQNFSIL